MPLAGVERGTRGERGDGQGRHPQRREEAGGVGIVSSRVGGVTALELTGELSTQAHSGFSFPGKQALTPEVGAAQALVDVFHEVLYRESVIEYLGL